MQKADERFQLLENLLSYASGPFFAKRQTHGYCFLGGSASGQQYVISVPDSGKKGHPGVFVCQQVFKFYCVFNEFGSFDFVFFGANKLFYLVWF